MCTRRGEIQPAQGEHCGGIKTTNTPPSPLRVQRFNGMKRTSRVVIPPTQKCKKHNTGVFYHRPQQGSRRNPAKRFRLEEDERQRASPAACGGTRDSSSARTTASIAFVWSAAKPLPCQMHWAGHGPTPPSCGQKPCTQIPGGSPHPLLATIGEKHEKRYQIQHAHGVRRP